MASKRAVQLLSLRSTVLFAHQTPRLSTQCARSISIIAQSPAPRNRTFNRQAINFPVASAQQKRWDSRAAEARGTKIYQFQDVLDILEQPSNSRLLIDVREPHEFEANTIPTSINIPVTSQPDALLLDDADFEDRFGFQKPPKAKEVVFFCKAGVRSSSAAGLARQAGYTKIGEYRGSWNDWQKNGGPGTKTPPKPDGMGEPTAPITETKPTAKKGDAGEEDLGNQKQKLDPKGGLLGRRQ